MKRFLIVSAIILVLIVAAGIGVRSYLRSQRVAQQVTARLETLVGGPVRVETVEIGLGSTAIHGLSLYEEGKDGDPEGLWLKIASLALDVSLWDLVSGNAMPKRVGVLGATLVLRFDRHGNLLTSLPDQSGLDGTEPMAADSLPAGVLEKGEIIFRKEGHPDVVANNVEAQLTHENHRLVLAASADNLELGKLLLSGSLEGDSQGATVQLKAVNKVRLTQAVLDRLPFVPAEIGQEVRIGEGDTTAELTLRYARKSNLRYRLEMVAENTRLAIPAIGLSARAAHGQIVVEDNLVHLRAVEGQAFGGMLRTEADLDFGGHATQLNFPKIQVQDVNLNDLPDNWNIPRNIRKIGANGKLTGTASLALTVTPRSITAKSAGDLLGLLAAAHGSSDWFVPVARLAAVHGYDTHAQGKGKGNVRDSAVGPGPIEFDWQIGPHPVPTSRGDTLSHPRVAGLLTDEMIVRLLQDGTKKAGASDYVDINLSMKDVSLPELLKNLEVKVPFALAGKASLQVKASMPTDQGKRFKATGSMRLTELTVAGIQLGDVDADLVYTNGVLELTSLKSSLGDAKDPGSVRGTGRLELDPPGELRADLIVDRVPIARIAALEKGRLQGTFSGKLNLRGRTDKLAIDTLSADGKITSDRLVINGMSLEQISSSIKLDKGVLRLPDLQLRLEGTPVAAAGELHLQDYSFRASLDLRKWNLAALEKFGGVDKTLAFSVGGAFTTSANVEGKLEPFQVAASGDARATDVKIDQFTAQALGFHWKTDGKTFALKDVKAELYGGAASGSGVVPMDPALPGKFDLRIEGLETKQLAKDLHVPFRIEGKADGTLRGTLPPVKEGETRKATLNLDVKAPKLRVQNIPTEQLHGTLDYQKGVLGYKLEGKTLGGTFDLEGEIPNKVQPIKEKAKNGRLSFRGIRIRRLAEALGLPDAEGLAGVLTLELHYTHKDGAIPHDGKGSIRIAGVRWKDRIIAENLQGDIAISDEQLQVRNLEGTLAEGTLSARLLYHFRQPSQSRFTLSLDNVESGTLLAPWLDGKVEGPLQARIRGNFSDGWRGTADFELTHGKILGVAVTQWHLPSTWSYSLAQNRGQIDIHETTATVARGRTTGKLSLAWDAGAARVEGNVRFNNADFKELLRQTVGPTEVAGGQATGRIDFSGNHVRSLNDVGAKVVVAFNQTQALQLPVLQQLSPFLGVGPSTTFQKGNMLARLEGGVLRIEQMNLQGNNIQLYLDGNVTLEGRLNLDAVAKTGNIGFPTDRLRLVGLRIPIAGPVPLAVLQEASNLLSNRLIYLQVGGTVRSPVIRPRPLPILREAAVRYFLDRSNIPIPDVR